MFRELLLNHRLNHPLRRRPVTQLHIHIGWYVIDLGADWIESWAAISVIQLPVSTQAIPLHAKMRNEQKAPDTRPKPLHGPPAFYIRPC